VKTTWKDDLKEAQYIGQIVAGRRRRDGGNWPSKAAHLVKVDYKPVEHQIKDHHPEASKDRPSKAITGNVDELSEGGHGDECNYGCPVSPIAASNHTAR